MKINICTINHNTDKDRRVTVSYDTDDMHLYADGEQIDGRELPTIEDAENECAALWGVDPVAVWELEWIERKENEPKRYHVMPEFWSAWGEDVDENTIVDENEIKRLAREWDMTVDALMEQVEEG